MSMTDESETQRLLDWLRALGLYAKIVRRALKDGSVSYRVTLKWRSGRTMHLFARDSWRWLEGEIVKTVCVLDGIDAPDWSAA